MSNSTHEKSPLLVRGEGQAGRPPSHSGIALLICDRDGVLVEDRSDYLRSPSDVRLIPGAAEALLNAQQRGFVLAIASNQSGIGRGIVRQEDAVQVHRAVVDQLAAVGVRIEVSFICPHGPDDGCSCRKPAPGMINAVLTWTRVPTANAVLVGDSVGDVRAALGARVRAILVRTGRGAVHEAALRASPDLDGVAVVDDLSAAVAMMVRELDP